MKQQSLKRCPIGIQTFEEIINKDYLYIDKTEYVYRMAYGASKYYFLSRPRRFGKSLLTSTLHCYFTGKKDLFKGLAIEKLETEWTEYPVLHFDMSLAKHVDKETLESMLDVQLFEHEKIYGKPERAVTLNDRMKTLIMRAYEQTGRQVVVLIDEYDAPLLDVVHEDENLPVLRNVMRNFYSPLKACDPYLRFVFLTGITKFSQLSIFSELNNIKNISMDEPYAAICGITKEEMLEQMGGYIERFALSQEMSKEDTLLKLQEKYDGYHFCEDTSVGLFNPFSLLNVFQKLKFGNFWFQTGTPTYLVDLLKKSDYDLRLLLNGVEVTASAFSEYRAEANNPLPMIYQSGYLTIKAYDKEVCLYTLQFPNDEVCYGFLNFLVPFYTKVTDDETGFHIAKFMRELKSGDVEAFMERLKIFFSGIPYELSDDTERHYQVIFHVVFTLLGQFIRSEVRSSRGRADAVVHTPTAIYVFEFKLDGTADAALKQIDEKGYLIPYTLDGRKLVKVGVNFSKETRNIDEYIVVEE